VRTSRRSVDFQGPHHDSAALQQRLDDVGLVGHHELSDGLVELGLVDEHHLTQPGGVQVDLSLAHMGGERHVDRPPHGLHVLPLRLGELALGVRPSDGVSVASEQLGGVHADGPLADALDLDQPVPHPAVGVTVDHMSGVPHRNLFVAEDGARGPARGAAPRGRGLPEMLAHQADEAALQDPLIPEAPLPLMVDGVTLVEDVLGHKAQRRLRVEQRGARDAVVVGPLAEVVPSQLTRMDTVRPPRIRSRVLHQILDERANKHRLVLGQVPSYWIGEPA